MPHTRVWPLLLLSLVLSPRLSAAEARSLLGINTDHPVFYSPACPTIDAIKTSQRFGSPRNPGDGRVALDDNGWPTDDFGVVVHADVPGVAGVYKLSCDGAARVSGFWGRTVVRNLKFDGKLTTADVEYKGGGAFALTFTGTAGGVRNLKLLRPGYTSGEQVFTNEYLKSKEPFGGVRLMNWTNTNKTKVVRWDDRCEPTDAQWSLDEKGGPWEPWLDYAAKHGKDLWLCVPHMADDDYVRGLAALCKARLGDAPVNLYLEDTNEYWNWQFPQAKWMDQQARAAAREGNLNDPAVSPGDLRHRYHARRTVQIGRIFREVFGNDDPRVRPVLTGQLANARATEDAVAWLERHHAPAKDHIYAVACAPYFGNYGTIAERIDLTAKDLADHLLTSAQRFSTPASTTAEAVKRFHAVARKAGVRSVAYEGGVDLGQAPQKVKGNVLTSYINARVQSQSLPETGRAVAEYLDWWFKSGGHEFFYFQDFSIYNRSGYWGLTNHPTQLDTPKYQAAAAAAKKYTDPPIGAEAK
jgi:hypothetical protein